MPKPRMSEAVRVVMDELTTSLLQHVSEEVLAEIIASSNARSERRLKANKVGKRPRDATYNARYMHGLMVQRMTDPPDALVVAVGLKGSDQIELPDMTPPTKEPPLPTTPEEDEFALSLALPKFEDYDEVFYTWPYVVDKVVESERVLVIGYASFRDKDTDELVYRNSAYYGPNDNLAGVGTVFKSLASSVGVLKNLKGNVRRFIKVVPYKPGARLRFWTNVRGEAEDRPHLNRYVVLGTDRLHHVSSRAAMDAFPTDGGLPYDPNTTPGTVDPRVAQIG